MPNGLVLNAIAVVELVRALCVAGLDPHFDASPRGDVEPPGLAGRESKQRCLVRLLK